ncbi:MAG: EAL domain-containing protein [Aliarcobacter sp.]|nr:EAL domain-containing protein [Aliarcobacter sp.]
MKERINKILEYSKNMNLLYVEDNAENRQSTSNILSIIFANIIIAVDGQDGLNKFKENNIDLIITDINMPNLNGIEMIKEIKKIDRNCDFIFLSANDDRKILLECIPLQANGFLVKPLDFEELISLIEEIIEKIQLLHESKNNEYYNEQYLALIDKNNIISKTNTNGEITYVNDNFCKISGYKREELLHKTHRVIRHFENPDELYEDIWNTIKVKEKVWEGVLKNKSKSGSTYYIKTIITPIRNIKGEIVEYITIRSNLNSSVDDKKYLFEQIEENNFSILVLLQIDEFEIFEKFYTNIIMGQIENTFAFNLLSYLPSEYAFEYKFENVYTLGNGRFGLLMKFDNLNNLDFNLQEYLNQFIDNVKNSNLKVDDLEFDLSITLSYGIGKYMLYEDCVTGLENAIKEKNAISFSNDSSIVASKEAKYNLEMIKTVKIALDNYKIVSYFQPIINNKTKEIEKYESLVRLIDENENVISPFHFLEISKKGNYYNKITHRVLENSFKILESIKAELSVNISFSDLEKEQTRLEIFSLLKNHKENAHRVIFELLEDENVKDFDVIKRFIKEIKNKGVQIAIDDFGAGYSNFERILEFEPDIIKIDGSLIKNIQTDVFSRDLVETIVAFAKKQNIKTVGEFVENEAIFNILNEIGVDYSQGYYFGKPISLKII